MPDACLHLQSRHDVDIPVVLFAAFVGAERRQTLTASGVEAARARVDAWHHEARCARYANVSRPDPRPRPTTSPRGYAARSRKSRSRPS